MHIAILAPSVCYDLLQKFILTFLFSILAAFLSGMLFSYVCVGLAVKGRRKV